MNSLWLYALGFVAQGCFGARSIIQWIHSERSGRVVSPTLFWVFSLMGASLFLIYGLIRKDIVIITGQTLSFFIYVRNLQLKGVWQSIPFALRALLLLLPLVFILSALLTFADLSFLSAAELTEPFLLIGAVGQLSLNGRYLYQWYHSERAQESILPLGFWMISAIASLLVIVYALFRNDPVLLTSQSLGMIIYSRNIMLHFRKVPISNEVA